MKQKEILKLLEEGQTLTRTRFLKWKRGKINGFGYMYHLEDVNNQIKSNQFDALLVLDKLTKIKDEGSTQIYKLKI